MSDLEFVSHRYLEDDIIEERAYQTEIVEAIRDVSSLVGLPTGTGKTTIALRVMVERLEQFYESDIETGHNDQWRCVMVAPTTTLVAQHAAFFAEVSKIPDHEILELTGDIQPPEKRGELWESATLVFATPQALQNDIMNDRISLASVVHLVFDECHHATGKHPYPYIADKYVQEAEFPLITGMSASPGSSRDEILTVCENLHLENIEVLTPDDEKLSDYLPETYIDFKKFELSDEVKELSSLLEKRMMQCVEVLAEQTEIVSTNDPEAFVSNTSFSELRELQGKAGDLRKKNAANAGLAQSLAAELRSLYDLKNVLETQGPRPFVRRFERKVSKVESGSASKYEERLVENSLVVEAYERAQEFDDETKKQEKLRESILQTLLNEGQAIVFTDNRDTVEALVEFFNERPDKISAARLVGKADTETNVGMSKSEQREVIEEFGAGEYDILVSTRVGEEGLDIPSVDLVVFYEPAPEGIRAIQRQGRTGRKTDGKVVVLVAEETRDEGYYWKAYHEKKSMREDMSKLQEEIEDGVEELLQDETEQAGLTEFTPSDTVQDSDSGDGSQESDSNVETETESLGGEASTSDDELVFGELESPVVYVDERETSSVVPKELDTDESVAIELTTLSVGDYVVGENTAVERKSMSDFLDTLVGSDRDLFQQVQDLQENYPNSFLLLEGDVEELYTRNINPVAIRGALLAVAIGFGLPIVPSRDEEETAKYLSRAAKKQQQEDSDDTIRTHAKKTKMSPDEQKVYVVSSIADIGKTRAEALLAHFGTVRDVMTADKQSITDVEGVGEKTAEKIVDVVTGEFGA